ncbi:DUF4097 family beta strand repeat-containing protein [Amycolatopsis samaneae]|uniref:DUF4097 family beta strand repeat-containing protein n=1 Tax=Amycolatopsis samaneae TaxID=664691 RepID=A0ABW5GP36_9PSEU
MSRGWLVAGVLWTALVLLAGAAGGWLWLASPELHEESTHLAFPPAARIQLDVDRGQVQLIASDTREVSVDRRLEWTDGKPSVRESGAAGTVRLSAHCPGEPTWRAAFTTECAARYTVRVPREMAIEVTTSLADVQIRGTVAAVTVSTTTGNVTLTNARGSLTAHTRTGRITGEDLAASTAEAVTGTGAIDLSFGLPPERVAARTGSGDVRVAVPPGDRYRLLRGVTSGRQTVGVGQDLAASRGIAAESATGDILLEYTAP